MLISCAVTRAATRRGPDVAARRAATPGYFAQLAEPRRDAALVLTPVAPLFAPTEAPFSDPFAAEPLDDPRWSSPRGTSPRRYTSQSSSLEPPPPEPLETAEKSRQIFEDTIRPVPTVDPAAAMPAAQKLVRKAIAAPLGTRLAQAPNAGVQPNSTPVAASDVPFGSAPSASADVASPSDGALAETAVPREARRESPIQFSEPPGPSKARGGRRATPRADLQASVPAQGQPGDLGELAAASLTRANGTPTAAQRDGAVAAAPALVGAPRIGLADEPSGPPPRIYIGVVEVTVAPPPPPSVQLARPAAPAAASGTLARGFGWRYGFGQS
jgi:hypothetical protein